MWVEFDFFVPAKNEDSGKKKRLSNLGLANKTRLWMAISVLACQIVCQGKAKMRGSAALYTLQSLVAT